MTKYRIRSVTGQKDGFGQITWDGDPTDHWQVVQVLDYGRDLEGGWRLTVVEAMRGVE